MALKGIVIDAGHGGSDPGAVANNLLEKDLTLKVSNYMYNRFKELGIPVSLTRDGDKTLSPEERVNLILGKYGNDRDIILISNHINAGGGDGAEVIYALRNTSSFSNRILNELEKAGQNLRKAYQLRLPSDPSKDYYFIHRDTPNIESVIVEYGFLDSPQDDVIQLKNNLEEYGEAVVKAVTDYKSINYILPTTDKYYIVIKGDSLWGIANKFGITVEELKALNNLKSNIITVGDKLIVKKPTEEIPENLLIYKVQSGDSLWSISRKFNTSIDELIQINNLSSNNLSINQQLFIPSVKEEIIETENIKYVVQRGDNLYSIANKYKVPVDDLKTENNLSSNVLQIGQILVIPSTSNFETYIVKSGDSLYKIARENNTTVDKLKLTNNLITNNLSIGQKLLIPKI